MINRFDFGVLVGFGGLILEKMRNNGERMIVGGGLRRV